MNTLIRKMKHLNSDKEYFYGDEFKDYICPNPFIYNEFMVGGPVCTCCYLRQPFGDLKAQDYMDVWNSPQAQKIRKSILDGDFSYCNKFKCAAMQQINHIKEEKVFPYRLIKKSTLKDEYFKNIVKQRITKLSNGPKIVSFDNDPTCNLFCPSCRHQRMSLSGKQYALAEELTRKMLDSIRSDVDQLWFAGTGDPFASKIYRQFFLNFDATKYPKAKIRIDTNGQLLTEDTWNTVLKKVHDKITIIAVSVDAATKSTYPTIRRGGDFDVLMKNLLFLSRLPQRKTTGLQLWIRLIIQKKNYQEMKQFVQLGKKLKANNVIFSTLSNWGTFSNEEYADHAIHLPTHPEHKKLVKILKDPIFKDPIVDMGNLSEYFEKVTS